MTDPTPVPVPDPTPATTVTRTRGQVNKAWLAEFTLDEKVLALAQKPDNAPLFADGDIDAAFCTGFGTDIQNAKNLASTAVQKTTGKKQQTGTEDALAGELVKHIQGIQKRAKQKYAATSPVLLKDYAVGVNYQTSRKVLEQTGTTIHAKLTGDAQTPADVLPGVKPARITDFKTALDAYTGSNPDQADAQGGATGVRAQLEAAVTALAAKRRQIQYAADDIWPHTEKANAGIRKEFGLPKSKALK
jgi:hypothetical protein